MYFCTRVRDWERMLLPSSVLILISLMVLPSTALPLVNKPLIPLEPGLPLGGKSVSLSNRFNDEYEFSEHNVAHYFAGINYTAMVGRPDKETGRRVLEWTPASGVNPWSLGSYFQGDILMPRKFFSSSGSGVVTSRTWRNGVIPYVIDKSFGKVHRANILEAFRWFHTHTCIKFVERRNHEDYVYMGSSQTGCFSSLGRIGGAQYLNLQLKGCANSVAVIIHELNHAVGFVHEQSRPERDDYINIIWKNIERSKYDQFNVIDLDDLGVPYDYRSIMHYGPYDFAINKHYPTITAKRAEVEIGGSESFTWSDIFKINRMYNCNGYRKS